MSPSLKIFTFIKRTKILQEGWLYPSNGRCLHPHLVVRSSGNFLIGSRFISDIKKWLLINVFSWRCQRYRKITGPHLLHKKTKCKVRKNTYLFFQFRQISKADVIYHVSATQEKKKRKISFVIVISTLINIRDTVIHSSLTSTSPSCKHNNSLFWTHKKFLATQLHFWPYHHVKHFLKTERYFKSRKFFNMEKLK